MLLKVSGRMQLLGTLLTLLLPGTGWAWFGGYPTYNNLGFTPRFRSGPAPGGSFYGNSASASPYGNVDEAALTQRELLEAARLEAARGFGGPGGAGAANSAPILLGGERERACGGVFSVPTNCLGSNIVRTLKSLAHVPPGSNGELRGKRTQSSDFDNARCCCTTIV